MDPDPSKQSFITPLVFMPLLVAVDTSLIVPVLILIFLLFCSAVISGSEVAFFSLSPQDFHNLEQENSVSSKRILQLRETPRTLLATILIVNNLINIMIVIFSDSIVSALFSAETNLAWGEYAYQNLFFNTLDPETWASVIEFSTTVILATFLLVLFGEITPKIYANVNNIKLAKWVSGVLIFLLKIFGGPSRVLVGSSHFIERRFKKTSNSSNSASKEEIDRAIDLTVLHEFDAETEKTMLKSIVKFGEVSVKQIMKARVDIVAVDLESTFNEVMAIVRESGYSRIPVYQDDLDNLVGILYVKDLLGHFNAPKDFEWQKLLRTNVLYVPEAKKINEVLKEFRNARVHMALVVDEYGGTSGLVTLEDILEEVIGEIRDEFDDDNEITYEKIDDFNYIFDGKTMINDMCKVLNLDKDIFEEIRGDADSVAGLFLEMYGQIPKLNTEIRFNKFLFQVISVTKRRIEKIKITIHAK